MLTSFITSRKTSYKANSKTAAIAPIATSY